MLVNHCIAVDERGCGKVDNRRGGDLMQVAVRDDRRPSLPSVAALLSPRRAVSDPRTKTEVAQTVGRAFHTAGRASLQELRIHRRSPSARITTQPLGGGYVEGQSRQGHHRCSGGSRRAGSRVRRQPGCGQRRDHAHDPGNVPWRDDDSGRCRVCKHGGDALAVHYTQGRTLAQLPEHGQRASGHSRRAGQCQDRQLALWQPSRSLLASVRQEGPTLIYGMATTAAHHGG